jgi:rhodanese-related sulfurtransferase
MTRRTTLLLFSTLLLLAQDSDPWKNSDLMEPEALAARLKTAAEKPAILYVGFPVLYRGAHIPGAVLAGPLSKPEGVEALKQAVAKLSKESSIVLYCGCCPFTKCPNVRPAFRILREMGYTNVKLVVMPTNLHTDWTAKGYPVEKAAGASGS